MNKNPNLILTENICNLTGWETPCSNFKMESPSSTGVPVLRVYQQNLVSYCNIQDNTTLDRVSCLVQGSVMRV